MCKILSRISISLNACLRENRYEIASNFYSKIVFGSPGLNNIVALRAYYSLLLSIRTRAPSRTRIRAQVIDKNRMALVATKSLGIGRDRSSVLSQLQCFGIIGRMD